MLIDRNIDIYCIREGLKFLIRSPTIDKYNIPAQCWVNINHAAQFLVRQGDTGRPLVSQGSPLDNSPDPTVRGFSDLPLRAGWEHLTSIN